MNSKIPHKTDGSIFYERTDALVNPVNCVGVMGDGLVALVREIENRAMNQLRFRRLGGLDWREVKPLITKVLEGVNRVEVVVFETREGVDCLIDFVIISHRSRRNCGDKEEGNETGGNLMRECSQRERSQKVQR